MMKMLINLNIFLKWYLIKKIYARGYITTLGAVYI